MVSAEQNRANLRSAERAVRIAMGVDLQDGSAPDLPYAQQIEYVGRLAAVILAHAAQFNAATLATASDVAGKTYSPLADASFSWEDFAGAAYAASPVSALVDVGEGAKSALSSLRWLLPLAMVAVVVIALLGFRKKVNA